MRLSCRPTPSFSTWAVRASLSTALLASAAASPAASPAALEAVPRVPPTFVENRGQLDPAVSFSLAGRDRQVFFGASGVTLALTDGGRRHAVRLEFPGGRTVAPAGRGPGRGVVSYFKGAPKAWTTGAATWGSLVYEQLWPGIDLVFDLDRDQLKYRFEVAPGADPDRIRLRFVGADQVSLARDGALLVATSAGSFRDERPLAHQDAAAGRQAVAANYVATDGSAWRIELGSHDRRLPLVVDPQVVVYAGFLGGLGLDEARGAAVDAGGHLYVVGHTESSQASFPATLGPDLTYGGVADAFVAKLDPDGQLVYAGYIGGSQADEALAVAVDGSGNAYVVGSTLSTESDGFPLQLAPDLTHNGASDGFVTVVNAAGTGLVYSGYLGGSGIDAARAVAVESGGIAYVGGSTQSSTGFPVSVGPDLTHNGGEDGFVTRLSAVGGILYSGFVGGSLDDVVLGVATEGSRAYLTGWANSAAAQGFPVAVGPSLVHAGDLDGFVARLNTAGSAFEYAGYLGGNSTDQLNAVAVDAGGSAYVTGSTQSNDFPALVGPGGSLRGPSDAVVAKVLADGTGLVYSGYLGGTSDENGTAIAVESGGQAYVAGSSGATGAPPERPVARPAGGPPTFPGTGGYDPTPNGGLDAFLVRLGPGGTLELGGFLGGSGDDVAQALAVLGGDVYLAGSTTSYEPTFPAVRGPQTSNQGGPADAFVARLSPCFAVTTTDDTLDVSPADGVCSDFSGQCSLRAAVMEANLNSGRDAICVPPGTYSLTIGGEDGTAAQGDLDIVEEVDINGTDASEVFVEDPTATRRLFHVRATAQGVDISRLTVRGGDGDTQGGGCIRVEAGASARLHEVVATNCSSEEGGAIQNLGTLVVERSEISYSTAYFSVTRSPSSSGGGGGLHNGVTGVLTLDGSSVLRNAGDAGGGIENLGSLLLRNSTVSENVAPSGGGILASAGSLVIENTTITKNEAQSGDGGGIVQQGGASVQLLNSILAGNSDFPASAPDCSTGAGSLTSAGYNLLGDDSGCAFTPATGDQVGSGVSPIDPILGPLADNGGPVRTHALLTGSPAFDLGSPSTPGSGGDACQPVDARGLPRPDASRCDVGGHEGLVNASADLSLSIVESADPVTTGGMVDYTVNVTNNSGDTATGTILRIDVQGPGALVGIGLAGTCDVVFGGAHCQVASIGSGATEAVNISVLALSPGSIVLDVSVSANLIEAAPGDEVASESTLVVGCSKTFDNEGGDSLWGNPLNWSGDTVPGFSDDVCIGPSFTVTILPADDGTINALYCDGSLVLAGGLLAPAANSYVAGSYTQSSGTLDGSSTLALQGGATWSGGTMMGSGLTQVPPGGSLLLNGGALLLDGRTVEVGGTATWQAGAVTASSGGTFHVFSGATFDIQSDQTWSAGAGSGAILNGGLLVKSAGGGTTTIAVPFSTIGEVRAGLGVLNFTSSYTQTAGLTRLEGGFLSTTSSFDIQGGELSGAGIVTGFVNNSGGVLKPGLSPGSLQITGSYIQGAGGTLEVELGGLTQGTQYDLLTVFGGTANLNGTLDVVLFGGFDPAIGDSFVPITFPSRTGTFASVNTPTLSGGRIWQTTHNAGNVTLAVAGIGADLEVQMTDSADPVDVGLTYSYNILVSNLGSAAATATTLSGTLPGTTTRVVTLTGVGSCSGTLTTYSCNLGTLNPGDQVLVAVHVLVIGAGGTVNHTANATTSAADGNPANNSALVSTTLNAGSCTRYFDNNFGSFSGVWQTANNWGPTNALPTSGTDVCIGEIYQVTLSSGNGDAAILRNEGTLTINTAGGLLRVAANSTTRNTALTSGSLGTTAAGVTITTAGPFTWNGGTLGQGLGILLVPAGQQLDITGAAVKTMTNFTLRNQGTVNHLNGPINFGAGTTLIDNQGLFDIQVNAAIQVPFSNSGTLAKTAGTGITAFNGGNFQNQPTGILDVQVGTVDLSAGSTVFAGSTFQGPGLLRLNGGLTSLLGSFDVSAANVELTTGGTLSPGNNSLVGNLLWTGGTISGTSFNIPSGSVLTAAGSGSMTLSGCTLNVSGRIDLTSTGAIRPTSGGFIAIHPTGLVDIQSDGSIGFTNPGPYNMSNAGILRKSGGSNPSLISPVLDSFGGTVETQSGTLRFDGFVTGPTTAIWNTSAGAAVEFTNSASFGTGTQFVGSGAARAMAGNTTLQGNLLSSNFELAGATFTSSATVTGTLAWTAGTLGNGSLTIPVGSTLNISGASEKLFGSSATLVNQGTTNWLGGNLRFAGSSSGIDNRAGAQFVIQASNRLFANAGSGFAGYVINAGTFRKGAGAGTTGIGDAPSDAVDFQNTGMLLAESGTLLFGQSLVQLGGTTSVTTGNLQVDSGFSLQGGTLTGVGTITGNVTNSGGVVRPGTSPGLLTISGNYVQGGGTLAIEVDGPIVGSQYDRLSVTGTATLGGTLDISQPSGSFTPTPPQTFDVMTFAGGSSGSFGVINNVFAPGYTVATLPTSVRLLGATADCLWNGTVGNWNDPSRWINCAGGSGTPVGTPGAPDRATINGGTVTANLVVGVTDLVLTGGNLQGSNPITVTGSFTWSGGDVSGSGVAETLTVGPAATLTITHGAALKSRRLINQGTATHTTGTFILDGTAEFRNEASFVANGGVTIVPSSGGGTFLNASGATFTKLGAGTYTIGNFLTTFDNEGTVDVSAGTLALVTGGTDTGAWTVAAGATLQQVAGTRTIQALGSITGAGELRITGGTLVVDGTLTSATLGLLGGFLQGSSAMTVTGTLNWGPGELRGIGVGETLTIAPGATATITHDAKLKERRLINQGTATHTAGTFVIDGTAEFRNEASFVANGGVTIVPSSGGGTFVNASGATFTKLGAGTYTIGNFLTAFDNAGTVDVAGGTLALVVGGSGAGSWTVAGGATLQMVAGTRTIQAPASVSGLGLLRASGGATTLQGTLTLPSVEVSSPGILQLDLSANPSIASLTLVGGTLRGASAITVTGSFTFSGGTVSGTGLAETLTVAPGATVALSDLTGGAILRSRRLINQGGITHSNGPFFLDAGAELRNEGSFLANGGTGITLAVSGGGTIVNANGALFTKAGAGTYTVQSLTAFDNAGTLQISAGTLRVVMPFTQTAGSTVLAGGDYLQGGPTGPVFSGGVLTGNGTITGSVLNSGATLRPGTTPGSMAIIGSYTQTAGGTLELEIGGLGPGSQHDLLILSGSPASFAGTLNVLLFGGFDPAVGNSFQAITFPSATGTFTTVNTPPLSGGRTWQTNYNATNFTLSIGGGACAPPPGYEKTWVSGTATPGDWSTAGNWSPSGVPTATDDVFICAAASAQPIVSVNVPTKDLLVEAGANVATDPGTTITAGGNVDATGPIGGNGKLTMTGVGVTLRGMVPSLEITGSTSLLGPTQALGQVVSRGTLTLAGQTLMSGSTFSTQDATGTLVMTNPADVLDVSGNVVFGGGSTAGALTAGQLRFTGDFSEGSAFVSTAFAASGSHVTVFRSPVGHAVGLVHAGSGSQFHEVRIEAPFLALLTPMVAGGTLVESNLAVATILGGQPLSVGGLDVDGLVFDNVTLTSTGGTITRFDNVTFQNQPPAATQLTLHHPGAAGMFVFNNTRFLTTPSTGLYISSTDSGAGLPLSWVRFVNSTPCDGTAFTQVANGAIVSWPCQTYDLSIADAAQNEGDAGTSLMGFLVTLSAPSPNLVEATYASAQGSATPGLDYQDVSGLLQISPGQTQFLIQVPVFGDLLPEGPENLQVDLSAPVNATLLDDRGDGTIVDDDDCTGFQVTTVESVPADTLTSVAAGADGLPRLAYVSGGNLRYARFDGQAWQYQTVDSGVLAESSMALDPADGEPGIAYIKGGRMNYAKRSPGGTWTLTTIPGSYPTVTGHRYTLRFDPSGHPGISFVTGMAPAGPWDLAFAAFDGAVWTVHTGLDAQACPHVSHDFEPDGDPVVAYCKFPFASEQLWRARLQGGTWNTGVIDDHFGNTNRVGFSNQLRALPGGGFGVAYYNLSLGDLHYATAADYAGPWTVGNIETAGAVGDYAGLDVFGGRPRASYVANGVGIRFAELLGSWVPEPVAATPNAIGTSVAAGPTGADHVTWYDRSRLEVRHARRAACLADLGDAPAPYPTLSAQGGARHSGFGLRRPEGIPILQLGLELDAEVDGQPDASATGDDLADLDDEDGVTFAGPLVGGTLASVTVQTSISSGTGRLDAWVDFDRNGSWNEAGEQIFSGTVVSNGPNNLSFPVPTGLTPGTSYARFRISGLGGLLPTGTTSGGEVEDHQVTLQPPPQVDLTVLKSASAPVVPVGGSFTYTVGVSNSTANAASNVVVLDTLPAEVTQVSAVPSQGSCAGDPAVVCHLGSLAAGGSASVTISVTALASGAAVLNTATVSADEPDSFPSDNSSSATVRINAPPTVSTIPPQSTLEDVATAPIGFTIGDDFTAHGSLLVSATSSDQVLVPDANLALGGSLASRTLVATPAPDRNGFTDITITVTDGDGLSASTMFRLTVTPQDDPPTLDPIPPLSLLEDAPLQTVNLSGITAGPFETGALGVTASSDNTLLIPNPAVAYVSPSPTGSLSFTPLPNTNGAATVTVTVDDAVILRHGRVPVFTTARSFTVTVVAVNDAPTLDPLSPLSVLEDSGSQGVSLTGIGAGPVNEAGQSLTVTASSDNPALVPNPTVSYSSPSATGSLTLTPAANAFGSATITVTVQDSGGVASGGVDTVTRTFTFTVQPVNDPPTLDPIPDRSINVAGGAQTVPLSGISIGPANEAPQTITILAASDNTSVVATPSVIYSSPNATGSLLITPTGLGSALITVTTRDSGGVANNGMDTVVRTFTVTVSSGPPMADVGITKTAAPSPAGVGQPLVYTLTASNAGPSAASGVTVFDYLPSGVDFVSAPGCTRLDRVVTCPVGNLAVAASSVFTVTVTPVVSAASLGNTGLVSSTSIDSNPDNDVATVTSSVLYTADLHLTLADSPDPVLAGQPLTYSLGLSNSGPSPATAATVQLPLPSGVSFVSASAGCSLQSVTVVCNLGSLDPGDSRSFSIVVRPTLPGTLHATATAASGEEFDPTPADNQQSVSTTVTAAADLSVTVTATPEPVTVNADLTYLLTVTNHGPQAATSVVLYDYLPSAITPVMVPGGCSVAGRVVACSLGSLAASQVVNVTLVVRPTQAPAALTNTALVVSQTADPESGNDTDTVTSNVAATTVAAQMAAPAPGSILPGSTVTFSWTGVTGALEYWLDFGRSPGSRKVTSVSAGTATSKQVNGLPQDGSVLFVRLWTKTPGGWAANDYSYRASSAATATPAHLTAPVPGSTLPDSTVTFAWAGGNGVLQYWLDIGSAAGGNDLYSGPAGAASSLSVSGLPGDGRRLFVRLWSQLPTEWAFDDQAYTAYSSGPLRGQFATPAPGSTLSAASASFGWTAGNQVLEFWLDVGTSLGGHQLYTASQGTALQGVVGGLPISGETLHVRLWSRLPGVGWVFDDAVYTALDTTPPPAQAAAITAPTAGSTLSAPVASFAWSAGVGVLEYWLEVGTSLGGRQIYSASQALATSRSVGGIPSNGADVFLRIWSRLPGTGWSHHDTTYRAPGP